VPVWLSACLSVCLAACAFVLPSVASVVAQNTACGEPEVTAQVLDQLVTQFDSRSAFAHGDGDGGIVVDDGNGDGGGGGAPQGRKVRNLVFTIGVIEEQKIENKKKEKKETEKEEKTRRKKTRKKEKQNKSPLQHLLVCGVRYLLPFFCVVLSTFVVGLIDSTLLHPIFAKEGITQFGFMLYCIHIAQVGVSMYV
jgi:hypothetical protein